MSFRAPALPVVANVDPMRIGQVLRNLLSNAIKFSPAGGVIGIVLEVVPDGFRLAVEDEGVGIPEAELESVFDKFVQSSKTRTSEGGTGLGLAICRELATAHGGWICARQRSPRGTLMEMVLPLDGGSDGDVRETTDDRAA
jgi:signal transduction histidine kinase